jgi:pimeloyl-ACP methyl ester carboxylesterase/predicted nucleotidyltransferase
MPSAEFPPEVTGLLGRLRDRLAEREDVVGIYVYGSLATGDYSPAASDIDVIALVRREPDKAMTRELTKLHTDLAATGGPAGQLHCLYVAEGTASDPERLCTYWFGDRMTQWQMKVLTRAELAAAGVALHGPWPPPGVKPVPVADAQAAVHAEVTGYWRRLSRKRKPWLRDSWVDHGLVVLPRAAALLTTGDLITKSEAISRLADFGVPDWLIQEIRHRRDGRPVTAGVPRRLSRARLARRVMHDGVARLSRLAPPASGPQGALEDGTLLLGDGRRLGYAQYGAPGGEPFFYFHGHPGSRMEGRFAHAAAAAAGLRVITLDRPGYGLSDFQPGRAITDWPGDVAEAADLLGIGRFSVAGASGGGPYALACAWRLPDRVMRVAVISGVGPYQVRGITRGMRWQNQVGFRWGSRWPAFALFLMRSMQRSITSRPAATVEALARAMSPTDAAIVRRPEVSDILISDITEAFRQGGQGAAWDMMLLARPWGFSLSEIEPEVHLWQGEADTLVPPAMGRYQAAQIPHCHARYLPGEGHLLIIDHMPDLIEAFRLCQVRRAGRGRWRRRGRQHADSPGSWAVEQGRAEPGHQAHRPLDARLGRGRPSRPALREGIPDTGQRLRHGRRVRIRPDLRPGHGLGQERPGGRRLRAADPRARHPPDRAAPVP